MVRIHSAQTSALGGWSLVTQRRHGRAGISLFAAALGAILVTSPSHATHYGSYYHPNNTFHVFYYGTSLTQTWINVVNWNRTNNLDPRVFDSVWTDYHDVADASVGNADLDGSTVGIVSCAGRDPTDQRMCTHYHVTYDHVSPMTLNQQRSVGCQEIGHTLSLGHRVNNSTSCMTDSTTDFPLYFDNHDKSAIDSYLPPGWLNGQHVY